MPQFPNDCRENPPKRDEAWDACVRSSSLGIGIGGFLGSIASIFLGPSSVLFAMGMSVTVALRHCRNLFREDQERKNMKILPPSKKKICPPESIQQPSSTIVEDKSEPPQKTEESSCFPFFSIIPIPDRPFGRVDKNDNDVSNNEDECSCNGVETDDKYNASECAKSNNHVDKTKKELTITCERDRGDNHEKNRSEIQKKATETECTCPPPKTEINKDTCQTKKEINDCTCPPPKTEINKATSQTKKEIDECTCPPKIEIDACTCPPKIEIDACTCPPKKEIDECTCPPKKEIDECTCPPKKEIDECTSPPKIEIDECTCPPKIEIDECTCQPEVKNR